MISSKWFLGLALVLYAGCTPASGALGPQGYEQSLAKYRVNYSDAARKKFLPDDWLLDNYAYDTTERAWKEKQGERYRATRLLDEDGDGTVSESEQKDENIFDLRFVNSHDGAVIWLKVHPMGSNDAGRDLDVILEHYANGLEGTGLFEQSSLFGLRTDVARHFTIFTVKKESLALGALPAVRGVFEIADVEKLRLNPAHRDSKAELVFAKVKYWQEFPANNSGKPAGGRWRNGLFVIGYYDDAARFESHLADLHALLGRIVIPASAVPTNTAPAARPATTAVAMPVATAAPAHDATPATSASAPPPPANK